MITIRNQKGMVLITAYIVILILAGFITAFFFRAIQESGLVQGQNDSMKALSNAEKAVAYAYFESSKKGWEWFTHNWNSEGDLVSVIPSPSAVRTQGGSADCYFVSSGNDQGCYAAKDGSFILKTFPDPRVQDVTVVKAKGISGNVQRLIEYRISRVAIYDFAWWTPYDLNLNNVGNNVNGGRVHTNGNIYMYSGKRLYGVDKMTTGKDKGIYYAWNTYYGPGYYDWYVDGSSNINGEVPIPHLGSPDASIPTAGTFRRWAGTKETDPYTTQTPWLYQDALGTWRWRSYGSVYVNTWPPRDWRDTEDFFYGDSQARYNVTVSGKVLNSQNTWIYPAKKDADGDIVFDAKGNIVQELPEQIPAELEGALWDWTKYNNYGKFGGKSQEALKFTVYDPVTAGKKPIEETRWKIVTDPITGKKSVVMVDPAEGGSTYWQMLQDYNYWKAIGYSDADAQTWSTHINPELLDGTYGSEVPAGQTTIKVDYTNSMKQTAAWNNFLSQSGLDDVLLANENGENMEAPRFATTYKEKSEKAGLYFSKTGGTVTLNYGVATGVTYNAKTCPAYDPANPDAYWTCLEQSIDLLVNTLNTDVNGNPLPVEQQTAKKVKFINTYTNKWNVVLELDLEKMKNAGTFPSNGILYSEVPVRLSNAKLLPSNNATFNVIGEENVYLKGDYNNYGTTQEEKNSNWMTSAVISKKQIYTLSSDFNDPQVTPAFVNYPNYPYVYVTTDATGNFIEADPKAGGGTWVYYGNYPSTSVQYNQALNLMSAINTDWRTTFNKNDPTGSSLYTVSSSHPIIDGQTWGVMPNRVQNNHTYNCLFASYYNGSSAGIPTGVNLERWINDAGSLRTKTMNGAYFQLDYGDEDDPNRFTAHKSDGPVDYFYYATFDYRASSRVAGSPYSGPYWLENSPSNPRSYDARFRNPLLAKNKGIFFGGGESSWREITCARDSCPQF